MSTLVKDPIANPFTENSGPYDLREARAATTIRQPFNLLIVTTHPDEGEGPCEVATVPCEFGKRSILIDLSEVTRIDSWGLALFIEAMQRITALGGSLLIFGMRENVLTILQAAKLDLVFHLCSSREEALAGLQPRRPAAVMTDGHRV